MALQGVEGFVTTSGVSALLVKARPNRVALAVGVPGVNRVTISTRNPAVVDQGLSFFNTTDCTLLTLANCGDWIQRDLFCVASAGTPTIGFVEVLEVP